MPDQTNPTARNTTPPSGFGVTARVTKGRIVLPRNRVVHEFMFNPSEVKIVHGWKWGEHGIPGNSHPVVGGGSGDDEVIEFSLVLDGDRGRMVKRRAQGIAADDGTASKTDVGYDLSSELNFYRSLTYPEQVSPTSAGVYVTGATPPTFVLTLGTMFTRVSAVARTISVHVVSFTPLLEPLRAKVDCTFRVKVPRPVYSNEIWLGTDPDTQDEVSSAITLGEWLE